MTTYRPGELLLVVFPFVGSLQGKTRPALALLDTGDADVVLARITSQSAGTPSDIVLQDWQGAGLLGPSVIRLHKIVTSEKNQVIRRIGALQPADHQQVAAVLGPTFGKW